MNRCAYVVPETGARCLFEAQEHSRYCKGCERNAFREQQDFNAWMLQVTLALEASCGLHPDDLPDCPYADWHSAGNTPEEVAQECLARFLGDDNAL